MAAPAELQEGLLEADHNAGEEEEALLQPPQEAADLPPAPLEAEATEELDGGAGAGAGASAGAPPERSALSREASLSGIPPPDLSGRPKRKLTGCRGLSTWFTATMLLGVVTAVGVICFAFAPPTQGAAPACRKSAAIAVVSAKDGSQSLVVWSGMGHGEDMYRDTRVFNLTQLQWKKAKVTGQDGKQVGLALSAVGHKPELEGLQQQRQGGQQQQQQAQEQQAGGMRLAMQLAWPWHRKAGVAGGKPPPPAPPPGPPPPPALPAARWKEGVAPLVGGSGMLVHGGAAQLKAHGGEVYLGDAWLLDLPGMRWRQVVYAKKNSSSSDGSSGAVQAGIPHPHARRAHSLVAYKDQEGRDLVLLFGGRRHDGLLMNDVWQGEVARDASTGQISLVWTLLHDPQAGVGKGPAPLPRKGHAAVMHNNSMLVIHGGRSEIYGYFGDVWAFLLGSREWVPLPPSIPVQPLGRDHHGAALSGNLLFIYGGRYGVTYASSHPLGDRWLFDLEARTWRQLPIRGLSPLPRFLYSSLQYSPAGGGADQFLVFGGETGFSCKLNDIWQLDLKTFRWTQLSSAFFGTKKCVSMFGQ